MGKYQLKHLGLEVIINNTVFTPEEGKLEVDHINRNTLDFKLSKLRFVSRSENLKNRKLLTPNKYIVYQKFDEFHNLIEEIPYSSDKSRMFEYINKSVKNNKMAYGFFWKRVDLELDTYINNYKIDLSKEEFIPIPGDNLKREISRNGIILEPNWKYSIGWRDLGGYRKLTVGGHHKYIHRLVYELFSKDTLTSSDYIDHIDTDPQNNSLSNLRKVSQKENMNNPVTVSKLSKPVLKYSLDGKLLEQFPSLTKACASIGISRDNNCIRLCCEGKLQKSHGFIWKYKD